MHYKGFVIHKYGKTRKELQEIVSLFERNNTARFKKIDTTDSVKFFADMATIDVIIFTEPIELLDIYLDAVGLKETILTWVTKKAGEVFSAFEMYRGYARAKGIEADEECWREQEVRVCVADITTPIPQLCIRNKVLLVRKSYKTATMSLGDFYTLEYIAKSYFFADLGTKRKEDAFQCVANFNPDACYTSADLTGGVWRNTLQVCFGETYKDTNQILLKDIISFYNENNVIGIYDIIKGLKEVYNKIQETEEDLVYTLPAVTDIYGLDRASVEMLFKASDVGNMTEKTFMERYMHKTDSLIDITYLIYYDKEKESYICQKVKYSEMIDLLQGVYADRPEDMVTLIAVEY